MNLLCLLGVHRWKFVNSRLTGYMRPDELVCQRCGATKDPR